MVGLRGFELDDQFFDSHDQLAYYIVILLGEDRILSSRPFQRAV